MSTRASEHTRPAELDEATIARWWHEQSAGQGLPDEIEPALIQRVAELALAGNDGAATRRHQGTGPASAGSANGAAHRERHAGSNSKGPGLTNQDLRSTTSHSSKEVIGA